MLIVDKREQEMLNIEISWFQSETKNLELIESKYISL